MCHRFMQQLEHLQECRKVNHSFPVASWDFCCYKQANLTLIRHNSEHTHVECELAGLGMNLLTLRISPCVPCHKPQCYFLGASMSFPCKMKILLELQHVSAVHFNTPPYFYLQLFSSVAFFQHSYKCPLS